MLQKLQQIKFSEEEIEDLKTIIADKELIDDEDLEQLKNQKKKLTGNDVTLGILFIKCFDVMFLNLDQFKKSEEKINKKIATFLNSFEIDSLRHFVNEYGEGKEYGDFIAEQNIMSVVSNNRESFLELIRLFFQIFGGED
jgi:hypothetical protein